MPTTNVMVYASRLSTNGLSPSVPFKDKREALLHMGNVMRGVGSGAVHAYAMEYSTAAAVGRNACIPLISISGSGTVGVKINGVTITTTWATSDIITMTTLAGLINASSDVLVSGIVRASNATVVIGQTSGTAPASIGVLDAMLYGVATEVKPEQYGYWQVSGSNPTDKLRIGVAINGHPGLSGKTVCYSLTHASSFSRLAHRSNQVPTSRSYGTGGASATSAWSRSSTALLWCTQRSRVGNAIVVEPVGTGMSVVLTDGTFSTSATRMSYGAGEDEAAPLIDAI